MPSARLLKGILILAASTAMSSAQFVGNCRLGEQETCGANMARVNAALTSAESAWGVITSPDAGLFERQIVAERCIRLMGPSWIPKVLSAKRELLREAAVHRFGVLRSSIDARGTGGLGRKSPPEAGTTRIILGHAFIVPEKWIDFPETDEQRKRAPWPYQVAGIVGANYDYGAGGLYEKIAAHSDPAELTTVALTLPCDNYNSALDFVNLTLIAARATHSASPAVFGAWLNAMHNQQGQPAAERATLGIMDKAVRAIGPDQPEDTWAMLQVLGLAELAIDDSNHAVGVFDGIAYMRPVPNTLLLAAARYLADSKDYTLDRKYWANKLFDTPEDLPFAEPASLFNKDGHRAADFDARMESYRKWLARRKPALEERARKEHAVIERARDKIAGATKACSVTER